MKLTFRAALHLGLAMLWQLFHIHHHSSLSASPMTYRTASPCFGSNFIFTILPFCRHRRWPIELHAQWPKLQCVSASPVPSCFEQTFSSASPCFGNFFIFTIQRNSGRPRHAILGFSRTWHIQLSLGIATDLSNCLSASPSSLSATYRHRQTEGARCSILVFLLQLFLLFFVFLFFGFLFFFFFFVFFFFFFLSFLLLFLLLLLLLLLRLPATTALAVAAAAANATAALRLLRVLLRPLPAAPSACCCRCHRSWCCCCSGEQAETYKLIFSPRNVSFETLVTLWFR